MAAAARSALFRRLSMGFLLVGRVFGDEQLRDCPFRRGEGAELGDVVE